MPKKDKKALKPLQSRLLVSLLGSRDIIDGAHLFWFVTFLFFFSTRNAPKPLRRSTFRRVGWQEAQLAGSFLTSVGRAQSENMRKDTAVLCGHVKCSETCRVKKAQNKRNCTKLSD